MVKNATRISIAITQRVAARGNGDTVIAGLLVKITKLASEQDYHSEETIVNVIITKPAGFMKGNEYESHRI